MSICKNKVTKNTKAFVNKVQSKKLHSLTNQNHYLEIPEPDITVLAKDLFPIDSKITIPAFSAKNDLVPKIDPNYCFDTKTVLSIITGFVHNKNVLIQGYHGTGKSTHIEQVAARLNWPCVRVNMDGSLSRGDLVGRDAIVIQDGKQITEFHDGILPWSLRRPVALILDEYDAIRPDVMFVLQRLLEADSRFVLLENNEVIHPHKFFRIFATSNTIGFGDNSGLYHGINPINQGQMDRWNIVTTLNYLEKDKEMKVIASQVKNLDKKIIKNMVNMADLTREGFKFGDLSTLMSLRTLINWAENYLIFEDLHYSFILTFLNKCDLREQVIVAEYYQRCFGVELLKDNFKT